MNKTRREFLRESMMGGAALGAAALLPGRLGQAWADEKGGKKLKLLFLGGTGFLGPHMVRAAIARGHAITLFNRGKTHPKLFPDVEKLKGDRYSDLSALEGERQWDAVIDTFTYVPRVVTASADLLAKRAKHYVVISSVSVYRDFLTPGMTEEAPLAEVEAEVVERVKHHRDVLPHYGGFKALCEKAAEASMPGRVANVRPGLIVGPGDPSDRFTYWPVRVSRGGEVLCPSAPKDLVQLIDVRDLAEFILITVDKRLTGAFNADSPRGKRTIGQIVEESKKATKSNARFTWVPVDFLEEQKVEPWSHMPVWTPATGEHAGFGDVSTEKAHKAGLTCRKLPDTIKATLKWWEEQPAERRAKLRAGIKPEREKEVLAAWHKRQRAGSKSN